MAKKIITPEEFDRRLEASTERLRQRRLVLEALVDELEGVLAKAQFALDFAFWDAASADAWRHITEWERNANEDPETLA